MRSRSEITRLGAKIFVFFTKSSAKNLMIEVRKILFFDSFKQAVGFYLEIWRATS